MVEEGVGATVRYPNDVVIKIHAFAVQPLDKDVLKGRGKRLRQFVKPRNKVLFCARKIYLVLNESTYLCVLFIVGSYSRKIFFRNSC